MHLLNAESRKVKAKSSYHIENLINSSPKLCYKAMITIISSNRNLWSNYEKKNIIYM